MEIPDNIVYALFLPIALFLLGIIIYILTQFTLKGYRFAERVYWNHIERKMLKEDKKREIIEC